MVKKYQEIKQEQFITELVLDAVAQEFVSLEEPFNTPYAKQLADLSFAIFLQQRLDRMNEGHYLTLEEMFEKFAKSKTQGVQKWTLV